MLAQVFQQSRWFAHESIVRNLDRLGAVSSERNHRLCHGPHSPPPLPALRRLRLAAFALLWAGVVLIPCPIVLPVELLLEPALILLIELDFHWRGRRELLFTEHVAEALAMQFANPRFYGQLPFVLRGGFGSNERIGPKAKSLGHFDVIPIEPAESHRLRPTVLLRLLAHAMLNGFYADFPSERKCASAYRAPQVLP